jgi:hypothetical protein
LIYVSQYRAGLGGIYGSDIQARSWKEAYRKAKERGLGEKVIGRSISRRGDFAPCSTVLRSRRYNALDRIHALCFLALLATSAKVATARTFFDDETGLIHQWIHLELRAKDPEAWGRLIPKGARRDLIRAVEELQRLIPGYPRV